MIEFIEIKNFKTLEYFTMATKRLNLFMGLNGMGKSSVIQALLLLRQSREDTGLTAGVLKLNGNLVEIGTSKDALYQNAEERVIEFNINFSSGDIEDSYVHEPEAIRLVPVNPKADGRENFLNEEGLFNGNFQYLGADRMPPSTSHAKGYINSHPNNRFLGKKGEYAVHFLRALGTEIIVPESLRHSTEKSNKLLNQVQAWLGEISPGVKLNVLDSQNQRELLLFFKFQGNSDTNFKPENVGFGLSYVLPVIVALLSTPAGGLVLLENPEAHLHPKGQAALGRLLALTAASGVQIFVETHSDHLINGVRVAASESHKNIAPEDVSIIFLDREIDESHTNSTFIQVNGHGALSHYPEKFMDEWGNQLLQLR